MVPLIRVFALGQELSQARHVVVKSREVQAREIGSDTRIYQCGDDLAAGTEDQGRMEGCSDRRCSASLRPSRHPPAP